MAEQRFVFGPFVLDPVRGVLSRDNVPVHIGQRALSVLHALLQANGRVVTKSELMDFAWPGTVVEEGNLSVQIAVLRRLLGPAPAGAGWIATAARSGYRFAAPVTVCAGTSDTSGLDDVAAPSKPSLAVLPFDNLSDDVDQEYFADGITEDIISSLSRFRWFLVIGRNSSFALKRRSIGAREVAQLLGVRYVLTGSVRRSAKRIRISAQLTDTRSAIQLWADHYDFDFGELFEVQDEIAAHVVGAIEPELLRTESAMAAGRRRGSRTITGWDLVRQGAWYFHQVTQATHLRARELFRAACKSDPQLAEAHAWLGRVCAGLVAYQWSKEEGIDLQEGMTAALRAVQLDEKDPYAHYSLAITSVFASEFAQAIRAADKAVELSPGFALGHLVLGMARLFSGNSAHAVGSLERGVRLNPHDPQNFVWYNLLAIALFFEGHQEKALQSATSALKVRPNWRPAMETALCCCQALGRAEAAREWVGRLAGAEASSDALGPLKRANPRWRDEMHVLLQSAGWHAGVCWR